MQPKPPQQLIRTYKRTMFGSAEGKFAKDADKLAKQGWHVQSQSQAGGLLGKIFTITVVYVR